MNDALADVGGHPEYRNNLDASCTFCCAKPGEPCRKCRVCDFCEDELPRGTPGKYCSMSCERRANDPEERF